MKKLLHFMGLILIGHFSNAQTWTTESAAEFGSVPRYMATTVHPTSGELYVAYVDALDGNNLKVVKSNGSSWEAVGGAINTSGSVAFPDINVNPVTGELWTAYRTDISASDRRLMVKRYDGTAWVAEGSNVSGASAPTQKIILQFDPSGNPYIAITINTGNISSGIFTNASGSWSSVIGSPLHTMWGMNYPSYDTLQYTYLENGGGVTLGQTVFNSSTGWSGNNPIGRTSTRIGGFEGLATANRPEIIGAIHALNTPDPVNIVAPALSLPSVPNSADAEGMSLQLVHNKMNGRTYLLFVNTDAELFLYETDGQSWALVGGLNITVPINKADDYLNAKLNIRQTDGRLFITYPEGGGITTSFLDPSPGLSKIYVDQDASGNGDGSSWENAFTSLRDAIESANNSLDTDTIWIKAGTYKPTLGGSRTDNYLIRKSGLKLFGGFSGSEMNLSERDFRSNQTIISGDVNDDDDPNDLAYNAPTRSDNAHKLFFIASNDVLFDGISFTNAQANGSSSAANVDERFDRGGAIHKAQNVSSLTIRNCTFSRNSGRVSPTIYAPFNSAGTKTVWIENAIFEYNSARYGGALEVTANASGCVADVNIYNSLFHNNSARDIENGELGFAGSSMVLFANVGTINTEIINNTFTENIDAGSTSGIETGTITLRRLENNGSRALNAKFYNNIFFHNYTDEEKTSINSLQIGRLNRPSNPINSIIFTHNNSNQTAANLVNITSSLTASDNVDLDPLFSSPSNGDFTLTGSSQVLDVGDNSKVPPSITEDINGIDRLLNGVVDLGAYEYFEDVTAPTVITQDISVLLDQNGEVTIQASDIDAGSSDDFTSSTSLTFSLDVQSFSCSDIGVQEVTLTVTDAAGNEASAIASVTVTDDLPPVVNTADITISLDNSGNASITTDQVDDGSSDNCSIASLSLDKSTFTQADVGVNEVTLTATDASGNTATGTASVNVTTNQAPEITMTVMNQTFEEDAGIVVLVADYTALFNDPDQDDLTYSFDSDNPDVTVAANGNELTAVATANYFGTANVTITASDGALSTDLIFQVEITAVNDAPVLVNEVVDQTATEDVPFSFQLQGNIFEDVDNDNLSTSVDGVPDWLDFDGLSGLFSGTPANEDVGTSTISVTVTDGEFSATDEFTITVENVNDAPSIVAVIPDQALQEDDPATTIDLSTVFEDVDGDQLTFSVTENLNAAISTDESNGILTLTPLTDANGIGSVEISATDGVLTTTTSFDVNVAPVNDAPIFTLSESDLQLETNFSPATITIFEESVPADETNQEVSYRIETDIDFATITIADGVITITSVPEASGTGTVSVVADDGEEANNTAEANFSLTVEKALSVSDLLSSGKVAVYPNPFADYLMIESEELISITIYDLDGKILEQKSLEKGRVDLTNANPGVYLLVVEKNGQRATSKIIKAN